MLSPEEDGANLEDSIVRCRCESVMSTSGLRRELQMRTAPLVGCQARPSRWHHSTRLGSLSIVPFVHCNVPGSLNGETSTGVGRSASPPTILPFGDVRLMRPHQLARVSEGVG